MPAKRDYLDRPNQYRKPGFGPRTTQVDPMMVRTTPDGEPEMVYLDAIDKILLRHKMTHPEWTYKRLGQEAGISYVTVWKRVRSPYFLKVLRSLEAYIMDELGHILKIASLDAVTTLLHLARGEDREGHADFTVPHAVQRQAARDILDIVAHRQQLEGFQDQGDEVWEAVVDTVGQIRTKQVTRGGQEVTPKTDYVERALQSMEDDDEESEGRDTRLVVPGTSIGSNEE